MPEKAWAAFTAMIKLKDKVENQTQAMKSQQQKIENLTERVIKLETQLEMLMRAAEAKRLR